MLIPKIVASDDEVGEILFLGDSFENIEVDADVVVVGVVVVAVVVDRVGIETDAGSRVLPLVTMTDELVEVVNPALGCRSRLSLSYIPSFRSSRSSKGLANIIPWTLLNTLLQIANCGVWGWDDRSDRAAWKFHSDWSSGRCKVR